MYPETENLTLKKRPIRQFLIYVRESQETKGSFKSTLLFWTLGGLSRFHPTWLLENSQIHWAPAAHVDGPAW